MPHQGFTSKFGAPDSAIVGTFYATAMRFALETAMARTRPVFTCWSTEGTLAKPESKGSFG